MKAAIGMVIAMVVIDVPVANIGIISGGRSNKLNKKISKVSVVVGSGSFAIKDSIESNVDAFITSDFKYHNFFEADNKAILIDIGHYESEKHIKLFIKEFLNKKLPNFTVLLSEQNINPVNYY